MDSESKDSSWIGEGLRFRCTGCGRCCTGSPGYVFLSPSDITRLAAHLQIGQKEFMRRYTRLVHGEVALLDEPRSDHCIFLKDRACSAYEARPTQCRTYPWWIHNISSREAWEETAKECEGINHPDAPLVPAEEIEAQCHIYLANVTER